MSSFKGSYRGMGELLVSPQMEEAMRVFAADVARRAVESAPVYEQGPHPGRYKGAFSVETGVKEGVSKTGEPTRRAYGRVVNDAPEAVFVEYGSKHNLAHRTLGRALIEKQG